MNVFSLLVSVWDLAGFTVHPVAYSSHLHHVLTVHISRVYSACDIPCVWSAHEGLFISVNMFSAPSGTLLFTLSAFGWVYSACNRFISSALCVCSAHDGLFISVKFFSAPSGTLLFTLSAWFTVHAIAFSSLLHCVCSAHDECLLWTFSVQPVKLCGSCSCNGLLCIWWHFLCSFPWILNL